MPIYHSLGQLPRKRHVVFLGLRYGVQDGTRGLDEVAGLASAILRRGLER